MTKKRKRKIAEKKMYRDTWNLDYAFCEWLHPRLIMFKKKTIADLHYPGDTYKFDGKEYYLDEMIQMMINLCEEIFMEDDLYVKKEQKLFDMWAVVGTSMWW